MRNRVDLETLTDVKNFCAAAAQVDGEVYLVDGKHKYKVSAKSIIGTMLAFTEWDSTWVESEIDCYQKLKQWIVEGTSMS